jgi:alkylation response protein AidB-like acyl-CoA dehydrogenase
MLQPKAYGGFESHPAAWVDAALALGRHCGSSGWLGGITGVHPWVLACFDDRAQREVWGEDPDTWVASPFSPTGAARRVDGGYALSGHWKFSSGTDFCDWAFLGGFVVGDDGKPATVPPTWMFFLLPRADYEIVEDSWNVMGLKGTGSKDVVARNAFVPDYRVIERPGMPAPNCPETGRVDRPEPLFRMPFSTMFGAAITSGVLGAAEGVLAHFVTFQRERVAHGGRGGDDPYIAFALAEATADIAASRLQVLDDLSRVFERVERGEVIPYADRARVRAAQVRATTRAIAAADQLFARAGANAIRTDHPFGRAWRDMHAGSQHILCVPGPPYQAYAATVQGTQPPLGMYL